VPSMTRMENFRELVARRHRVPVSSYDELHSWSIEHPDQFWELVWEFGGVQCSRAPDSVLHSQAMPGARWFEGARLNYVDTVLAHRDNPGPAVIAVSEDGSRAELSWEQLADRVASVAEWLRTQGVGSNDRVVGYVANSAETIVAFLATAAVGATWACCAPDYGARAAGDRLAQLEPTVLVAVAGYRFGGRVHDRREEVSELVGLLGVRAVVGLERDGLRLDQSDLTAPLFRWEDVEATGHDDSFTTEQVPRDHPLWVLFTSGTTGKPKGIVHGHAGVVVTHLALLGLHQDLGVGETLFWHTTTNWMLWNIVVGALLTGATTVTYEGSPVHPGPDRLWQLVESERVTVFGTSPGHLQLCRDEGLQPGCDFDLPHLRRIAVTGAPAAPSIFQWVSEAVSTTTPLDSISGGTDVVGAFLGGAPGVEAAPGRLAAAVLGVAAEAWDDAGRAVFDEVGELVITRPMPSMPIGFLNDPDGSKYAAAYFATFPGVWRHGDWVTRHSDGGWTVHGRSDSTLNRHGVRLGSADLYEVVEADEAVAEALVLGVERPNGAYRMPMFLVPTPGAHIDDAVIGRLRERLRDVSPRHVPDEFHVVSGIPHTRTGKKLEVPLKRIMQGSPQESVLRPGAVDDPALLDQFRTLAASWAEQEQREA
jgi:acetoacetyl-CoA synthetase